jgi:hypothetical protein
VVRVSIWEPVVLLKLFVPLRLGVVALDRLHCLWGEERHA